MITPSGNDDTKLLNDAIASGETTLGAGAFQVSNTILIPPGANVRGQGIGRTVLHMLPTAPGVRTGEVVRVSSGASVFDLTTDSLGATCDGIIAEDAENVIIDACEVLLHAAHCYGIWSHRSRNVLITRCCVDGKCDVQDNSIPQEGIEVYCGKNVRVSQCTVRNCGKAAINIFTDKPGDLGEEFTIRGNTIWDSTWGIYVVSNDHCTLSGLIIRDNEIFPCGIADIKLTTGPGSKLFAKLSHNKHRTRQFNVDHSDTVSIEEEL